MKLKNGFTLMESIIVIGIIAILSLVSVNTIVSFQKDAVLEASAEEIVSVLRTARTKSVGSELVLLDGETADMFLPDDLPKYGVKVGTEAENTTYHLVRQSAGMGEVFLENYTVGEKLLLTPVNLAVLFDRLTGTTPNTTLILQRVDNIRTVTIQIDDKGVSWQKI